MADVGAMRSMILEDRAPARSVRPDGLVPTLVAGLASLMIAMGIGRFAFTPILPLMQSATGLGDHGASLLAAGNFLGYLVGAVLGGFVPPGRLRTLMVRVCLAGTVLGTALMAVSGPTLPFATWMAGRLIAGAGGAMLVVLATAIVIDRLAILGRTDLAGFHFFGVGAGITLSGLLVMTTASRIGWQGDWLVLALIAAMLAIPAALWLRDTDRAVHSPPLPARAVTIGIVPLLIAYFCTGAGYSVTATFLVAFLKRVPEMRAVGDLAWIVVGVAAMPSTVLLSRWGARRGALLVLVLAFLAQTVSIILPVLVPNAPAALASAILFGGTVPGIMALTFTLGRDASGARAIGWLTAAFSAGQVLGPLAAGLLMEEGGSFAPPIWAATAIDGLGALMLVTGGRGAWYRKRGLA